MNVALTRPSVLQAGDERRGKLEREAAERYDRRGAAQGQQGCALLGRQPSVGRELRLITS